MKKKFNLYYIINLFLALFAVTSLVISLTKTGDVMTTSDNVQKINIGTIATYLKFLPENKIQTIAQIALHNLGLALIAYILSLFSCGILGFLPLCSAFFVAGGVLRASNSMSTVIFVALELIGMSLSVFGGAYIFNLRKKNNMSIKKVCIFSLLLILILAVTYLLASYIETGLMQNMWRQKL